MLRAIFGEKRVEQILCNFGVRHLQCVFDDVDHGRFQSGVGKQLDLRLADAGRFEDRVEKLSQFLCSRIFFIHEVAEDAEKLFVEVFQGQVVAAGRYDRTRAGDVDLDGLGRSAIGDRNGLFAACRRVETADHAGDDRDLSACNVEICSVKIELVTLQIFGAERADLEVGESRLGYFDRLFDGHAVVGDRDGFFACRRGVEPDQHVRRQILDGGIARTPSDGQVEIAEIFVQIVIRLPIDHVEGHDLGRRRDAANAEFKDIVDVGYPVDPALDPEGVVALFERDGRAFVFLSQLFVGVRFVSELKIRCKHDVGQRKGVAVVLDGESDRLGGAVDDRIGHAFDAGDVHGERLAVVAACNGAEKQRQHERHGNH